MQRARRDLTIVGCPHLTGIVTKATTKTTASGGEATLCVFLSSTFELFTPSLGCDSPWTHGNTWDSYMVNPRNVCTCCQLFFHSPLCIRISNCHSMRIEEGWEKLLLLLFCYCCAFGNLKCSLLNHKKCQLHFSLQRGHGVICFPFL